MVAISGEASIGGSIAPYPSSFSCARVSIASVNWNKVKFVHGLLRPDIANSLSASNLSQAARQARHLAADTTYLGNGCAMEDAFVISLSSRM